ncbi:MAG: HDOD domain-containing protein, partial [Desulfuromonadaceae bacterium]|nr:HDOD domain-containing protein [Desulfuromonadaceae bacterium]
MLQIPKAILNSIEALQLQSPPQLLLRFLHLVEDDRTTIPELATLVGQDPSLSARVLTVANSPALQRGTVSKSLTRCLVNLGTRLARTLAGCLVVQNVFSPAVNNRKYSFSGFWGHSLLVAELSREISVAVAYTDIEEAYLAGILHDIGQLLLLGGMENSYGRLLESSGDETDLLNAETISLGTTHCAVGTWLVDKWELSSFMADSILFHHKTAEEIVCADRLSQIIWAAHVLSEQIKFLDPKQRTQLLDLEAVIALLGVDVSVLMAIHKRCIERVTVIAEALGINDFSTVKTLPSLLLQPCEPGRFGGRENDHAHTSLEEAVRDMAMMQPLQQDLASLESEEELLLGIREFAQILFVPGRFAFLLLRSDKPVLSGATLSGQPEILQQIEIPLVVGQSLA